MLKHPDVPALQLDLRYLDSGSDAVDSNLDARVAKLPGRDSKNIKSVTAVAPSGG
jgi:hypothetical protein